MNGAERWAHRLGMAISPLFPTGSTYPPGEHHAMLDGRRASFACSIVEPTAITQKESRDWQWSADLAHHVLITPIGVQVRSGRDSQARTFTRDSIETRLEEFVKFLDNSRVLALPDVVSFLVEEFRQIWAANGHATGQSALAAFLFALHAAGQTDPGVIDDRNWRRKIALDMGIDNPGVIEEGLSSTTIELARGLQARAPLGLQLVPSLVLRHAAGRLFQEAHAIPQWSPKSGQ